MKFDRGTNAAMLQGSGMHEDQAHSQSDRPASGAKQRSIDNSIRPSMHNSKMKFDLPNTKELKLQELAMMSISPLVRSIHHWWLERAERHYLICADVEQQRAREAQMNAAYYQKRAALARSARN